MSVLDLLKGDKPVQMDRGPNQEEIITFVENEFRRRQDECRPFHLQWRLNISMIEGQQHIDMNTMAMDLYEIPKLYWWEERKVYNHIGPIVDTRVARLSRIRPILKTRPPGTGEIEDMRSTKVSNMLLKQTHYDEQMQSKLMECYLWMEACGSVIEKNIWNKNAGKVVGRYATTDPETGEQKEEDVREGDVDTVICNAFEIYPDSIFNASVEDCRSIIHAKAFHIDAVEEEWGVKVEAEETTAMQLQKSMIGMGGIGQGTGGFHFGTGKLKDHVIVKEFSEIPSKKYPEGRIIITANKKLLHYGPLPFPVGEDNKPALNFSKADCIKRPGCFWGRTVTERLIPVQRQYNSVKNRITEYLNRAAIGQWTAPQGSITDMDLFEAEAGAPGAIHIYNQGYDRPSMVETPALPSAFVSEEISLMQAFSQISGVSELSRQSKADAGVKSGVAIDLALQQDDTRLSTTASNIESFMITNGKQWLRLYKKFAQGMRVLRAVGKNRVIEVIDWTASDIRSDDVIIEPGSAMAESAAQRRALVFDLMNTPLMLDPDTGKISKERQAKLLEMIEFGNWEDADDDAELHIAKSDRENKNMSQGMMPQAVSYDDHLLHITRHNKHRLTAEYEEMVAQNPMMDAIFQQHVNMHLMFITPAIMAGQPQPGDNSSKGGGNIGATA